MQFIGQASNKGYVLVDVSLKFVIRLILFKNAGHILWTITLKMKIIKVTKLHHLKDLMAIKDSILV